jgi:ABC-type branched-subunit amino acid transport system substrate-binding protein
VQGKEKALTGFRFQGAGRRLGLTFAIAATALVAACARPQVAEPVGPAAPAPGAMPAASGEVLGAGSVRVAMLVPKTATGNAGQAGLAFRNAAELALRDFPDAGVQLVVYDTAGTREGARTAGATALAEGADMILGPVFADDVRAVAPQARAAGVPIVAFSSDATVAAPGVYLLSYLPGGDIDRIVRFAAGRGRTTFAALLPANAYGVVAEAAFRQAVADAGGRVAMIERYAGNEADIRAKAEAMAAIAPQYDALLVPDGAAAPLVAETLAAAGAAGSVQLLGSGQWDDAIVLNSPSLGGGWFPAPTRDEFEGFAQRYSASYGAPPPRNATIAYDGTVLAVGLVRQFGEERFSPTVITNPNGFAGIDGVFRFAPSGLNERGLAVYEVTGAGARLIEAAPRRLMGAAS